jgi:hypothetical protein
MTPVESVLDRFKKPINLIRKKKNQIRRKIKETMEFSPYRETLTYKLELLNVIQSDMKRICGQYDRRHMNFAKHLKR